MKKIKLGGKSQCWAMVDNDDYCSLVKIRWYETSNGYAAHKDRDKYLLMHRLIMGNPIIDVDHINRNRLDNRKRNLRVVTRRLNLLNKTLNHVSKTGIRGVFPWGRKWVVQFTIYGKTKRFGTYSDIEAARSKAASVYKEIVRNEDL